MTVRGRVRVRVRVSWCRVRGRVRGRVSWCRGPTAAKSRTTAASEQRRLNLPSSAEAVSLRPCT